MCTDDFSDFDQTNADNHDHPRCAFLFTQIRLACHLSKFRKLIWRLPGPSDRMSARVYPLLQHCSATVSKLCDCV